MDTIFLMTFVFALLIISYVYLAYPILVTVFPGRHTTSLEPLYYPRVTVIFCAHNEEAFLPDKITNCENLDYPAHLLEFCVGSDGSTDGTNDLLQSWAQDPRVRLTMSSERVGKTALLNRIVPTATER